MINQAAIDELFGYRAPTPEQIKAYVAVRVAAREFATILLEFCPDCEERDRAVVRLKDCVDSANSSIKLG